MPDAIAARRRRTHGLPRCAARRRRRGPPGADLGGVTIRCEVAGDGPLTCVYRHGLGSSGAAFAEEDMARYAARFRTVAWDRRGLGRSGPADRYSLPPCAADLAAPLDRLEAERAVVFGVSRGGGFGAFACSGGDEHGGTGLRRWIQPVALPAARRTVSEEARSHRTPGRSAPRGPASLAGLAEVGVRAVKRRAARAQRSRPAGRAGRGRRLACPARRWRHRPRNRESGRRSGRDARGPAASWRRTHGSRPASTCCGPAAGTAIRR